MKTFVLSDSSINCYGFRVLTSGIDLTQFRRNPLMLWMHTRADSLLPIGSWDNIRVEGDRLLAEPHFDPADSFAQTIKSKVEAGYVRSASIGHIEPRETSDAPALRLAGQTGLTVTRCTIKEASIVDIGANDNALTLVNRLGQTVEAGQFSAFLSSFSNSASHIPTLSALLSDPAALLSYDELHKSGEMERLQSRNLALYQLKFYDEFGKFPRDGQPDAATVKAWQDRSIGIELAALKAMSFNELMQHGKITRLKELDALTYQLEYVQHFGKLPNL